MYCRELADFLASKDSGSRTWPASANTENTRRNFRKKANKFVLLDGTLHYLHPKTQKHLRVIRASEKDAILHACHVVPTAGHQGVNKTTSLIMSRYFWPGPQYTDITNFIGKLYTYLTAPGPFSMA